MIASRQRGRIRPLLRCALVVLALIAAAGLSSAQSAGSLPTLGDAGDMSLSAEKRLGDRIAAEIYRDPDYVDDPVLTEYMQSIWQPLLAASRARGELTPELSERFAWELMLVRDRTINAFALPGGYLGVHLGLIGLVGSRDELASVLGHEMSHVTQRHISRLLARQSQQTPWMLAGMILGALAARRSPDAAQAAIVGSQAVAAQTQLNFSRDMEREADRVGFGVMTQAGFDGQGVVSFFDKLQQANRINDNGSYPYLRSHPLTSERIADAQLRVQSQQLADKQPAAADPLPTARKAQTTLEDALMAARARVLADPGVDALRAWVSEAQALGFEALSPTRKAGVLYAAALSAARLRDLDAAHALMARLTVLVASDPPAARAVRLLAAELALGRGDAVPALALRDAATETRPELLLSAQAQVQSGQAAAAASRLQTWVALHPKDTAAWTLLASARSAQGQILSAIRAEAEARVAQMDYSAAVDRLKAAQEMARHGAVGGASGPNAGNEHIEASIIDTRVRQVELLLREQTLERRVDHQSE